MARRRPTGRFPALRQGQRRESLWFSVGESQVTLAAANTAVLTNLLNAAALALTPFTIVRTILNWSMRSDQTAATESAETGLGVAVVSVQASAIGVTAVPTPFTDLGSDLWLLHQVIQSSFIFISGVGFNQPANTQRLVDSRAMRKVEEGQDVVFVLENSGVSDGTFNQLSGRMLIKLH